MSKTQVWYPNIDMKMTGHRLKQRIKDSGYSVKDVQVYLQLSCPQPIYRWFKGEILPSVDHLYMLSKLLHLHMESLLVSQVKNLDLWKDTMVEVKVKAFDGWSWKWKLAYKDILGGRRVILD